MTPAERFEILKDKYYFDEDAALDKKKFIETKCRHIKGAKAGQHLILEDFQYHDIIKPIFGLKVQKGGRRLINVVYLELPRKNGKTTLMGGVETALLFNDGEPGAEIYNCAGDDEQAGLLFSIVKGMVAKDAELSSASRSYLSSIVYGDSFIKKITSKSNTKHGFNSHGIIYDELHVAPTRELFDILFTSMGSRRNPLFVAITTAGQDMESICYKQHDKSLQLLGGVAEDDNYWGVVYAAPRKADISDENVWRACNPLYDASEELRIFLKRAYNTISTEPAFESTFRRLHLNQWVGTAETWITDDTWMDNKAEPICEGPCYAGLDLSTVSDVSAYVLYFPNSGSVLCYFWVPEDSVHERSRKEGINYNTWVDRGYITATPGNGIDYDYIMNTMIETREKYDIKAIGYDRYKIEDLANKFDRQKVDLKEWPIFPIGQGYASLSEPTRNIERLVIKKQLRHGGNPVLRWMCSNVAIESDSQENIKINKKKSKEKVDGMVSLAIAIAAEIQSEPAPRSRYEDNPEIDMVNI